MQNDIKIELTGNPFVDNGLMVIASIAGLEDINELRLSHLKTVYGNGEQITRWNSQLKSFTMVFGINNPLKNPSYKNEELKIYIYKNTLSGFLNCIDNVVETGNRCWSCGSITNFDFGEMCNKVVEEKTGRRSEDKSLGRDWFPLSGSLGSDAQALPAASMSPCICPKCLFAIHYLPLGLFLLQGRLSVFQSNSIDFWYELVKSYVNENQSRIHTGLYETIGQKDNKALILQLLKFFDGIQKEKRRFHIPEETILYVWRFSNSGTSPGCVIEKIPNSALEFLQKAVDNGLGNEINNILRKEGKNPKFSLYRSLMETRDYSNLYPYKKWDGASAKLFSLYQSQICGKHPSALKNAQKISKSICKSLSEKELERIKRSEAFRKERDSRNKVKVAILKMAEEGDLNIEDYLDVFQMECAPGFSVKWDGWNTIRFYLHHSEDELDFDFMTDKKTISNALLDSSFVRYYAGCIYNEYIKDRGVERFRTDVVKKISRLNQLQWLESQFIKLAESHDAFTYSDWLKIVTLESGVVFTSEFIFQMRILWNQWLRENILSVDTEGLLKTYDNSDSLPPKISNLVKATFNDFIAKRGEEKFSKEILSDLRKKKIGLYWFERKLKNERNDDIEPLADDDWNDFITKDGNIIKSEALFKLNLAMANLLKTNVKNK